MEHIVAIAKLFGVAATAENTSVISGGLINTTYKIADAYILQKINTAVFTNPQLIAYNNASIYTYHKKYFPNQIFQTPVLAANNTYLVHYPKGIYRMFEYIPNTYTINAVSNNNQAYEAALQFGKFTSNLHAFNCTNLHTTIPNFHNLSLRFHTLATVVQNAQLLLLQTANDVLKGIEKYKQLVHIYTAITNHKHCLQRVTHHDTKISNVLFNKENKGVCVIDTDTVMPGFYISDVGDMMRTYTCTQNEESIDFKSIEVQPHAYEATAIGYMAFMSKHLHVQERNYFFYAGAIIMYMQCIRFITDFLQGNIYYTTSHFLHNYNRAYNQLCLLESYMQQQKKLEKLG